jgi:hypothetical protein
LVTFHWKGNRTRFCNYNIFAIFGRQNKKVLNRTIQYIELFKALYMHNMLDGDNGGLHIKLEGLLLDIRKKEL